MDSQFRSRQDTLEDIMNSSHITCPFLSCPTIFRLPKESEHEEDNSCRSSPAPHLLKNSVIVLPLGNGERLQERCPNSSKAISPRWHSIDPHQCMHHPVLDGLWKRRVINLSKFEVCAPGLRQRTLCTQPKRC